LTATIEKYSDISSVLAERKDIVHCIELTGKPNPNNSSFIPYLLSVLIVAE